MRPASAGNRRFRRSPGLTKLAAAMGSALFLWAAPAWTAEIDDVIADLGSGLDNVRMSSVPSNGAFPGLTIKFAALRDSSGLPPELAADVEAITIQVSSAMQRRYAGRFRFVSDASHDALLADLSEQVSDPAERARIAADLKAQTRADILIRGIVFSSDDDHRMIFQAVSVGTAEILTTTRAIAIGSPPAPAAIEIAGTPADDPAGIPPGTDGVFRPIALETEQLLLRNGYDPGRVDGYIDEDLRHALREYQAASALEPNGRMTRRTVENLRRDRRHR